MEAVIYLKHFQSLIAHLTHHLICEDKIIQFAYAGISDVGMVAFPKFVALVKKDDVLTDAHH